MTRIELAGRYETIRVEAGNAFQYPYPSGAVIAGKPDILAIESAESLVCDCKTGKPKVSDQIQVQMYMHLLPLCFPEFRHAPLHGRVVYPDRRIEIPPAAVEGRFVEHLDFFIHLLADEATPPKAASVAECRFCTITDGDCPDRIQIGRPCKQAG